MPVRRHPLFLSPQAKAIEVDSEIARRLERSAALFGDPMQRLVPRFFERLLARAPELAHLFSSDRDLLQAKFAAMLSTIISSLDQPEVLRRPLRELGKRHEEYGATPEHYPIVAEELLAAMAEAAGDRWTAEDHDDWRLALMMISRAMLGP